MDEEIKQRLDNIERMAKQIRCDIQHIYGYCAGVETVADDYLLLQSNKEDDKQK